MDWARDLPGWPHADWSRQLACGPTLWHAQIHGDGPLVLFLHGAGASTHSWRSVMEDMAADHRVVALDLPGQGFSRAGPGSGFGLEAMSEAICALCLQEGWQPQAIAAHSAGAAIALHLAHLLRARAGAAPRVLAVNPALREFGGAAGVLFPLLAKTLALNPLAAWLFTLGPAPKARARRLITATGSRLDAEGIGYYARLLQDRAHVQGTLNMMAQWSLEPLRNLPPDPPGGLHIAVGLNDRAVPPRHALSASERWQGCTVSQYPGLGHLLHEEAPHLATALLRQPQQQHGEA